LLLSKTDVSTAPTAFEGYGMGAQQVAKAFIPRSRNIKNLQSASGMRLNSIDFNTFHSYSNSRGESRGHHRYNTLTHKNELAMRPGIFSRDSDL